MKIIIGKTAGFCFGVKNAVTKTEKELIKNKNIYCLGELVHNNQVTEELIKNGAKFIENIEEAKEKVVIRAHGIEKNIYKKAAELGLDLIDLTCPKVLYIHKVAEEYADNGYYIFVIGKAEHPEVIGTVSFCGNSYYIIEKKEKIEEAIKEFKKSNKEKAVVIAQTTFSLEEFNGIIEKMNNIIEKLEIKNTICSATKQRQEETEDIAKQVDIMIIIGSKHSSNSTKLYELSRKYCENTIFIETEKELNISKIDEKTVIGIMAGASTPDESIEKVVEKLKKIC